VASIIKLAEPNTMAAEYRLEYSGFFGVCKPSTCRRLCDGRKRGGQTPVGACLFEYRISFEVPTELAIEFARWSLGWLRELALKHAWNALADRPGERNWPDILRLGMGSRAKTWCGFLNNFRRSRHLWQVPL
jgi:hypothetical protein